MYCLVELKCRSTDFHLVALACAVMDTKILFRK